MYIGIPNFAVMRTYTIITNYIVMTATLTTKYSVITSVARNRTVMISFVLITDYTFEELSSDNKLHFNSLKYTLKKAYIR